MPVKRPHRLLWSLLVNQLHAFRFVEKKREELVDYD